MVALVEPVTPLAEKKPRGPSTGIGVALSGGGYRAMLFHVGALLRLYETGLLEQCSRISSVSGGSITAAKLAIEWPALVTRDDFFDRVVAPLRELAAVTIDKPSIITGILLPGRISDRVAGTYRKLLFGGLTLQDLPRRPEFVINATNVETGTLWRFSRKMMGDYKVGEIREPRTPLARAVAASSAFPPFLSPAQLRVRPSEFSKVFADDKRLLSNISLTDGGVYDNLGLETVWKAYRNVLVSNAGAALAPNPSPAANWPEHSRRVIGIMHAQVTTLRQRQLIASLQLKEGETGWRRGAYWAVGSDIANYKLADALPAPFERTMELAQIPTRLGALSDTLQERLINWGYAICDTAIRKHFRQKNDPPAAFPYPGGV